MNKSHINQYLKIQDNAWDHKFNVDNYSYINKSKNQSMVLNFFDVNLLKYKKLPNKLTNALQIKSYQKDQSKLIRKYFKQPEKYLEIDCDLLSFYVDCTNTQTINKLVDVDNGLTKIKTKALSQLLEITASSHVGNVNHCRQEVEPKYTKVFTARLFTNYAKYFKVYIAEGKHSGVRIDFIPSRFINVELNMFFGHLSSVLSRTAYRQFINKAHYRRVDIAFNMPGVFQPFVFFHHHLQRSIRTGECWPDNALAETTYLGRKDTSNHFICYDKILKEAKSHFRNNPMPKRDRVRMIKDLAVVTRIERRHFTKRAKTDLIPLSDLPLIDTKLEDIRIFDPRYLCELTQNETRELLKDKSKKSSASEVLETVYEQVKEKCVIRLSAGEFEKKKHKLLVNLVNTIQKPKQLLANDLLDIAKNKRLEVADQQLPITEEHKKLKAYKSRAKNTFIKAGAGTGKTTQIVLRVKELIHNKRVSDEKITVLAYTNKAVKQLQRRLHRELSIDIRVLTFTKWCSDLLKHYLPETYGSYRFVEVVNKKPMPLLKNIQQIIDENNFTLKPELVNEAMALSSNKSIRVKSAAKRLGANTQVAELQTVIKIQNTWMHCNRLWSFESVLVDLEKALKKPALSEVIAEDHNHILMDEMQDANKVQWKILSRLANSGANLFVVGDTSQSIFEFRGADPTLIEEFYRELSKKKKYIAKINYRSSANLLALTNIARRYAEPEAPMLLTLDLEPGCKPSNLQARNQEELKLRISESIDLLKEEGFGPRDSAFLSRTNRLVDLSKDICESKGFTSKGTCLTIHKAKGLERDACVVIDPRFHNQVMDTRGEFLNLIYVALTRARKRLIIIRKTDASHFYSDGMDDDINIIDILASQLKLFDNPTR